MPAREYDLQKRLIDYSVEIIELAEALPRSIAGNQLAKQLIRSETSSALSYGEAQGAESRRDFVHKLKIVLKELRETFVGLKIIEGRFRKSNPRKIQLAIAETDALASIMYRSIETAKKNDQLNK